MNRKHVVAGLIALVIAAGASPALADEPSEAAGNPGTKLVRGVVNASTGWMEVPVQTARGAEEAGLPGLIGGVFKGVGLGAARTVIGGFEIGTFLLPIPERYEPVIKPATVFDRK